MRTSQKSQLALKIAQMLSLHHHKDIAYKIINQNDFLMIVGFFVDSDRFHPNRFSVRYFIQPLYIKFDFIDLSLGDVVGEWEITNLNNMSDTICQIYNTKLSHLNSINDVISELLNNQILYYGSQGSKEEFFAYSYLAINEKTKAILFLTSLIELNKNDNKEWFANICASATQIYKLLQQKNYTEVRNVMLSWQAQTKSCLGL